MTRTEAATSVRRDPSYDLLFELLDQHRCLGSRSDTDLAGELRAASQALVPRMGVTHSSTVAALGGSLLPSTHLRALAARQIAEQAWARHRDAVADVRALTVRTGALYDEHTTAEQGRGIADQVFRTVPPLTGDARRRAASAVARTGLLSRVACFDRIDRRDADGLDDDVFAILHAYASHSPDVGVAVVALANHVWQTDTRMSRASRVASDDGARTADHVKVAFDVGDGRIDVLASALDWSQATTMRWGTDGQLTADERDAPTGIRPAEKDPWVVARKLAAMAGATRRGPA